MRLSLLTLLVVACATPDDPAPPTDVGDTVGVPTDDTDPVDEVCEEAGTPARPPLRRLSADQVRWTVTDLVDRLGDAEQREAVAALTDEAWQAFAPADTPTSTPDDPRGGYRRLDNTVFQEHVDGQLQLAQWLSVEQGLWRTTAGLDCTLEDASCLADWIRSVGLLVHRRPLTDDEVAGFVALHASSTSDHPRADVLVVMLASPWFAYHVERGDPSGETRRLGSFELANRLAYHLWQSLPDGALFEAAADDSLLGDEVLEAQARRMLADPRAQRGMGTFFEDWLRVRRIGRMDSVNNTPRYLAFAGDFAVDDQTHLRMREELVALGLHHMLTAPGTFDDFFLSDVHLTTDASLASLYGEEPWDGQGEPPRLSDGRRTGLLTRVGMLASGGVETRPVRKGVEIREALLCEPIPPPPANADVTPPSSSPANTTREQTVAKTEVPGSVCASCHTGLINPLGFATEDFDALGRPRDVQPLFMGDRQTGEAPIDTTGEVPVAGEIVPFEDVGELTHELLASGDLHACMASELARFTAGRPLDLDAERCTVAGFGAELAAGRSLPDLVVDLILWPAFRELGRPPNEEAP